MEPSDAGLLAQWNRGRDSDAFMELVVRHSAMVYRTCLRLLGNAADAEDVTQECFVELAKAEGRIQAMHAGWLYGVAVKRSAFRIRSETRRRAREKAYFEAQPIQHEPTWEDIEPELDTCIAELPEGLRVAIVLRFLEGLTYEETGRRMGLPASTAQYRIQKGLEELRKRLAARGVGAGVPLLAALLLAGAAQGAPAPSGLTVSIGKMVLAKGATAAAASALVIGGSTVMKNWIAAVIAIVVIGCLILVARSPWRHPPAGVPPNVVSAADPLPVSAPPLETSLARPDSVDETPTAPTAAPVTTGAGSTGSVRGIAIHVDTQQPVPNLVFGLWKYEGVSPHGGSKNIGTVRTDAQGRFAFEAREVTYYWLALEDENLTEYDNGSVNIKRPGQVVDDYVLRVGPGASIAGRVYDAATGQGLSGVVVMANNGWRKVETDKDGRYRIGGLDGRGGGMFLDKTGPYANLFRLGLNGRSVELKPRQQLTGVDFPLEKGVVLPGLVVNETEEPLIGGQANLNGSALVEGTEKHMYITAQIGPDGRFRIEGVNPTFEWSELSVWGTRTAGDPEGHAYEIYSEVPNIARWSGERRFVLKSAAHACLRVTDAMTGQPVEAFELCLQQGQHRILDIGLRNMFKSVEASDGRFCRGIPQGFTTLFVRAEGYVMGLAQVETTIPQQDVEAELSLQPGAIIEGTVKDWSGDPVRGACIYDAPIPSGDDYDKKATAVTSTDNSGEFRAIVLPDKKSLCAWSEGLGTADAAVSVAAGQTTHVDFVLGAGARVSGHITEKGRPALGSVSYSIRKDGGATEEGKVQVDDGAYRIAGLPSGRGVLTIEARSESASPRTTQLPVETTEGKETVVDHDFTDASTITGTVRLNGEPVLTATLAAFQAGEPGPMDTAPVQALGGVYEISTDLEGPVTITVAVPNGTGLIARRDTVDVTPGATLQHDFDLVSGGATIEGQVLQASPDVALNDLHVALLQGTLGPDDRQFEKYYLATALVAYTQPGDDRRFRLEGIPDGDYTLVARATTSANQPAYAASYVTVRNGESQTVDLAIQ